ncbi:MAG: hypothetical protein IH852_12330 [Bacteroidetes bacterium]|nr:hypothetical protein [Bacteroidota bacterium]
MLLILVASIDFLVNIPFGYWRTNVDRFSLLWILSIHLPIPFIILLRLYSGIGFEFISYPIMIIAFILGQLAGTKYYVKRTTLFLKPVSSCLFMDTYRSFRS